MTIARAVSDFLTDCKIDYHVFPHEYTECAADSARALHVEPARMAKAVVLATEQLRGRLYRLAVLPAARDLDLDAVHNLTHENLRLAKEYELTVLFPDCAVGAIPAVGGAYGLPTLVDESLKACNSDVFFEAGDHEALIRVRAEQFRRLMVDAQCGAISCRSV